MAKFDLQYFKTGTAEYKIKMVRLDFKKNKSDVEGNPETDATCKEDSEKNWKIRSNYLDMLRIEQEHNKKKRERIQTQKRRSLIIFFPCLLQKYFA